MKAYKYLNKKEKQAIDITLTFWKYAAETGCKLKGDWEGVTELEKYPGRCGVCYVTGYRLSTRFTKKRCKRCILYAPIASIPFSTCGDFMRWAGAQRTRKEYAKIIHDKILKYVEGK
jgi:hypothetical protein